MRLTKLFVWGDIFSLGIQGGGSNLTIHQNTARAGTYMVVAGLLIQMILLALFFATAIIFRRRLKKEPTTESVTTDKPWRRTLNMLYTVSTLIFVRSIFRVVEYAQGVDGYCLTHEWTLYALDAVPMFFACIVFWWWWPGSIQLDPEDEENIELGIWQKPGKRVFVRLNTR
jgi:hypothetical protein